MQVTKLFPTMAIIALAAVVGGGLWPAPIAESSRAAAPAVGVLTETVRCVENENKIVFVSDRDAPLSNYDIYVMPAPADERSAPAAREQIVRLTDAPGYDGWPAWSPDRCWIAFTSSRDGDHEIYVMKADSSELTCLTHDPASDRMPTWSPDGGRIAFVSNRDGNDEIYVMQQDGSQPVRLTDDPNEDQWPDWSPNGERIAFASRRGGNFDIYAMSPDGSQLVNLSNDPAEDTNPKWSPDGQRLAFISDRTDYPEIHIANPDGSVVEQASTFKYYWPLARWGLAWAPGGDAFAFASALPGDEGAYDIELCSGMPLHSAIIQVTDDPYIEEYPDW